ncbi:MAG TPA: oxalate/formate MFS antiporter [Stellaceae bacterium]|jgi:OFA family oxalate/formate antiporter-like MFS transporter|nr:oxalate/formate MFS antiporter [Stellaceae bacterium]
MAEHAGAGAAQRSNYRWLQLALGIGCMVMIANLQYGWTLFVLPIDAKYHWGRAAIQVAFSIFVLTETWLVPVEGWFVDRFGPKLVVLIGGILVGAAWVLNSIASSLVLLYVAAALGGIGAGAVYGTCVGNALKWFPDRRGLCAGLTAAGFGAGSALTIIPIQKVIAGSGYEAAFLYFGIAQGVVVVVLSLFLAAPRRGETGAAPARVLQTTRDYAPIDMLQTPIFWVLYAMFVLVAAGGLMATAQLAPIARDFKVDAVPVSLIGITLPALTFALSLDRILNGVTRPVFGWVSDHIGRENTMLIAFGAEAVGIWALSAFGHDPVSFVILSGIVFFAWGEIYSLFPATCTDAYGVTYATTNAGLLYTAKGTASLLVPFGNVLALAYGSWHLVFVVAALMNLLAALAAPLVLRPLRTRHQALIAARGQAAANAARGLVR